MKPCPVCKTLYSDDTLRFCLQDGAPLGDAKAQEAPTVALNEVATVVASWRNHRTQTELLDRYEAKRPMPIAVVILIFAGVVLLGVIGAFLPVYIVLQFGVFLLACFLGGHVVSKVRPNMYNCHVSITNAISGIIILAGFLHVITTNLNMSSAIGATVVFICSINIAAGFIITHRLIGTVRK